jgi:DNA-binding response OmpR family regulator
LKILLAEDTRDLNRVETVALEHEGFDVDSVFDGVEALEKMSENGYDAIVLDIMMPKKDGLEVLTEMRARNIVTPTLMLTAKTEIDDRVAGLDAGADDYLTKPFAMKEFLARVRAMTRRKTVYAARKLKFGDFSLDSENFELACENSMRLSVKEFELLQTLVLNSDHEVDTDYLLEHVWEGVDNADGETVWLYISYLRGKLKSIASNVLIEGERDGNYRLVTEG